MKKEDANDEKKSFSSVISAFLIKSRVVILSIVGVLFAAAIVLAVFFAVRENMQGKVFEEIDSISLEVVKARSLETAEGQTAKSDELIVSLETIAAKNKKNDAGVRARMLIAEIYFERKDFEHACAAWLEAASATAHSYTSPICYYNAAVCFEELGALDKSVEYLQKVIASSDFSVIPRALFSLGRLEEQRGNYAQAVPYYERLTGEYPADNWTNLAQSRIIALQAVGLVN